MEVWLEERIEGGVGLLGCIKGIGEGVDGVVCEGSGVRICWCEELEGLGFVELGVLKEEVVVGISEEGGMYGEANL